MAKARNRSSHLVIFLLGNRIKLVVVTPGTIHGKPQERLANRTDQFFDFIGAGLTFHPFTASDHRVVDGRDNKTAGSQSFGITTVDHISGQLHTNKLVIPQIGVKCRNHPIAKRPDILTRVVSLKSIAFAIAGNIQPVASPAFPVMRRIKYLV